MFFGSSIDDQKAKVQKISETHTATNSSSNQPYSNSTYAAQDSTLSSANAYSYPTAANPWGAYAVQNVRLVLNSLIDSCSNF